MQEVNYDLYGIQIDAFDALVEPLEKVLGVKFEAHSSDYWGEYYRCGRVIHENFELKPNLDGEGEWLEKNHKDKNALLYVSETQRSEEIEKKLLSNFPQMKLLWRNTYPKEVEE